MNQHFLWSRFNASTLQRFNASTRQRFDDSKRHFKELRLDRKSVSPLFEKNK
jgi:hypothetical protein